MPVRYSRLEIASPALEFSIAHFTIFSPKVRENLHGHNYRVACDLTAPVSSDGLIFDYDIVKQALGRLCAEIDEKLVLPERSPHLLLEDEGDYLIAMFGGERLPFLKRDVLTLPIANTTVEELSHYLLERLRVDDDLQNRGIREITVRVSSGPGQGAASTWHND